MAAGIRAGGFFEPAGTRHATGTNGARNPAFGHEPVAAPQRQRQGAHRWHHRTNAPRGTRDGNEWTNPAVAVARGCGYLHIDIGKGQLTVTSGAIRGFLMTLRITSVGFRGIFNRGLKVAPLAATLAAALLAAAPRDAGSAEARPFSALFGSWSGEGKIMRVEGPSERIRCRASYEPAGGAQISIRLDCNSESYKFNLSSNVTYEGGRISGSWSEASRGVGGNISGRSNPNGSQVQALAQSPAFSANISLATRGARQSVQIVSPGSDVREVTIGLERR
jgi:hypothetical protein